MYRPQSRRRLDRSLLIRLLTVSVAVPLAAPLAAQGGLVQRANKIAEDTGGLFSTIDSGDRFGAASASGLDLDGDGQSEVFIGAPGDDDGGVDRGAVYVLFLKPDGTVAGETKISSTSGGFQGSLMDGDFFGSAVVPLGDADGDGRFEMAVGAPGDDGGGSDRGAVWLLELNADGSVHEQRELDDAAVPAALLQDGDAFGASLAGLGDQDGDSVQDLAIGAPGRDGAGVDRGSLWTVLLDSSNGLKAANEIGLGNGAVGGPLDDDDHFGASLAGMGDVNNDGFGDLAVGTPGDDDGGVDRGAVWIVFLTPNGLSRDETKISANHGGLSAGLSDGDAFGSALASSRLDADSVPDLLAGAPNTDGLGSDRGAFWVVLVASDGTVRSDVQVGEGQAGFQGVLRDDERFGSSVAFLGDLDGDGAVELGIGAEGDQTGGTNSGSIWNAFTQPSEETPNLGTGLNPVAFFGGTDRPRIGRVWDPEVAVLTDGSASRDPIVHWVAVSDRRTTPTSLGMMGELLVELGGTSLKGVYMSPALQRFMIPIPPDARLVGMQFFTQGAESDSNSLRLTNGIDIIIGF